MLEKWNIEMVVFPETNRKYFGLPLLSVGFSTIPLFHYSIIPGSFFGGL
jgi:hypothetical protein